MLVRFLISKDATNLINALKDFIKNCVFFSTIKSDKINLIKKSKYTNRYSSKSTAFTQSFYTSSNEIFSCIFLAVMK